MKPVAESSKAADTEAFEAAVGAWQGNKKGAPQGAPNPETTLREQGCDQIMPKTHQSVTSNNANE